MLYIDVDNWLKEWGMLQIYILHELQYVYFEMKQFSFIEVENLT